LVTKLPISLPLAQASLNFVRGPYMFHIKSADTTFYPPPEATKFEFRCGPRTNLEIWANDQVALHISNDFTKIKFFTGNNVFNLPKDLFIDNSDANSLIVLALNDVYVYEVKDEN